MQDREAPISPQGGRVLLTGQKLMTVLCIRSHAFVEWEGALEITSLEVPKNSKVEHRTVWQFIWLVEKSRLQRDWLEPCSPHLIFIYVEKTD